MRIITRAEINAMLAKLILTVGCNDRQLAIDILLADLSSNELEDYMVSLKTPIYKPLRGVDF